MQAIVHDPNYSLAYVGLADCYNLMREYTLMPSNEAYSRALAAAKKAVELDDQSSEAHASLAFVSFFGMWDVVTGDREFRRAIDLNPNNAAPHHWFANGYRPGTRRWGTRRRHRGPKGLRFRRGARHARGHAAGPEKTLCPALGSTHRPRLDLRHARQQGRSSAIPSGSLRATRRLAALCRRLSRIQQPARPARLPRSPSPHEPPPRRSPLTHAATLRAPPLHKFL